jgi:hypothetical protein
MSDIEGKVARVATTECGPRRSFKAEMLAVRYRLIVIRYSSEEECEKLMFVLGVLRHKIDTFLCRSVLMNSFRLTFSRRRR